MTSTTPTPTVSSLPPAAAPRTSDRTFGILSLAGGLIGLVMAHTVVIPIAAIVLGFVSRRKESDATVYSTWGIVLGFVALFGWILVALVAAAFALPFLALHGFAS